MTGASQQVKTRREGLVSDSRLVQECLKGKESAWSTLIDKYKNLIFSIPIRYGFSEEDSADIFQAVCMDLLVELPRLRKPNALAGWLIQVTRNKCFHRKQEQQRSRVQEMDDWEAHDTSEGPENLVLQVQQDQLIRDALLQLSSRCQQLVHMLFFEVPARPYQEVAQDLGLAAGSIGFIRRRCLEKLRQRLQHMGLK
jgi:RNA polymerase sigma factor (sigma-70 family)